MAWVTEYDMTWHSQDCSGSVWLQRDGGTYQMPLTLKRGSLVIKDSLPSWEDPIVRKNCVFTIVNDCSDFYELMPLMTISEGQIKVIVTMVFAYPGDNIIFEGFLNCEAVSQSMVNKADINLTASGLIDKLQWDAPDSIDTVQDMSLIDIIRDCLSMTGSEYDINVECPLYETNCPLGEGDTAFNLTAVSTELFWIDNIERVSALEILTWILTSMNCYLYWFQEAWYITHYECLEILNRSYVTYSFGTSYDYDTPGVYSGLFSAIPKDVHAPTIHPQVFGSQILTVSPGQQQIDISLDQLQYFNELNGDLSEVEESDVNPGWVELRTWHALYSAWDSIWQGWPSGSISNALNRLGSYDIVSDDGVLNGLTTHFKVTVSPSTTLTISWKCYAKDPPSPYSDHFWAAPEDMEVVFHWYLRIAYGDYFRYDEDTDSWVKHSVLVANTLTIRGTDFDQDLKIYEGQFVVPIGELYDGTSGESEDLSLIFRMGTETVTDEGDETWTDEPMNSVSYGDFQAATDSNPEDNLYEGEIVTDFLDQKTITMELFDGGWAYRNSLKRMGLDAGGNYGWFSLTSLWSYDGTDFNLLALKLLQSKYRLYRIARQKIEVQYKVSDPEAYDDWNPLALFWDNKQSDKKFVVAYQTRTLDDNLITVGLWEYDGTETINLE